tara:strand:+ start:353 stop:1036 length:684 start_codon:yes stop_codon:yes gene_type:complete
MNILIVAAHPDDEVIGCGASIAKWAKDGNNVNVIILAEGATSRDTVRNRATRSSDLLSLAEAAQKAGTILGSVSVKLLNFPDNRMDSVDRLDVVKAIEEHIFLTNPHTVVTHHVGDVNVDHQIVSESVITACRPQPKSIVKRLLAFEVNSSTEWQVPGKNHSFHPNWYEDVTDTLKLKFEALSQYETELRDWPHARSKEAIENLARWRGASVGYEAAEAFMLMREIR